MNQAKSLFSGALLVLLCACMPAFGQASELFFSEYIEGSSSNKALEIYNGTGAAVDLSEYSVELYSNGSNTATSSVNLSGMLANGDVFVIANSSANGTISAVADITSGVTNYNGDDAITLSKNGTIVDMIGVVGVDPGSQWGSGDASTGENTIRRIDTICDPDPDGFLGNETDLSAQWLGFAQDTADGLGAHVANCGIAINQPVAVTCPADLSIAIGDGAGVTATANDPDGTVVSIDVTDVSPMPAAGSITAGAFAGGESTVTVSTDVPAGTYTVTLTATNDDMPVQTNTCTFELTVTLGDTGWVINEFLADPANDLPGDANGDGVRNGSDDEFIEIVNTTGVDVDIAGWTIEDGAQLRHTFPANTVVRNTEAIVIFGGGTPTETFGDAIVQTASEGAVGLNNTGDDIIFRNDLNQIVAQVNYGSEGGNNQSLTRDPDLIGDFVEHSTAGLIRGGALFSPGTRVDGAPFFVEPSGADDLFFSEYIEGGSFNKALEIYNGTGAPVDLSNYSVETYNNGAGSPNSTEDLNGMLADGDVYVISDNQAVQAIQDVSDINSSVASFNGDDAIVLKKNGTIIDMIGVVGSDPGSQWGSGDASTQNNTIRRLAAVCSGDADGFLGNEADLTGEWAGFAQDTFDGLGSHTANCSVVSNQPVVINCGDDLNLLVGEGGTTTISASDADGSVVSILIDSISPMPAAGTITVDVIPSRGLTPIAEVTLTVSTDVPAGNYTVELIASNDDPTPQTATCSLLVNVNSPVTIPQIQGNGDTSPFEGQFVLTSGNVVTALAGNGFYMQVASLGRDGDPETSDGIFVFTDSAPTVSVGDEVTVSGDIVEFFGFTEFSGNLTVTVDSSGNPLPAPVVLDANLPSSDPSGASLERVEGMLVQVNGAFVSAPTDQFGDASITTGSTRAFREPGIETPGLKGQPIWDGNPEIFEINPDGVGLANEDIFAGATVDATGVIGFSFGDYQLNPTSLTVNDPKGGLPRAVRAREKGEFTVGSQNLFRYIGASRGDSFADRTIKIADHIREVLGAPDVLAVSEVGSIGDLQTIANQITADDASIIYTPQLIEGNDVGGIDVGFLVRDTVQIIGLTQLLDDVQLTFDNSTLHDRPPLLLEASFDGFEFGVIAIHNRSLSNIDDSSDGERVRQKRYEQALTIAEAIQAMQINDPDMRLIVTGDFNAYEFTDGYVDSMGIITGNLDPLGALIPGVDVVNPNLTNHVLSLDAEERYSFVFGGSAQVLDHLLSTQNMDPFISEVQFSRGNADVPNNLVDDSGTPLRASDHDGIVAFIRPPGEPADLVAEITVVKNAPERGIEAGLEVEIGDTLTFTVTITNIGVGDQPDDPGSDEFSITMPPSLAVLDASSASGVTNTIMNTVTWNGAIAASGSVTITIEALVNEISVGNIEIQGDVNFDSDGDGVNDATTLTDDPNSPGGSDPIIILGTSAVPILSPAGLLIFILGLAATAVYLRRRREAV